MKRTLAAIAACLALYPLAALAWCESYPTVAEEFSDSAMVLVGKVTAEEKVNAAGENYFDGTNYRLTVIDILQGKKIKSLTLFSENSSGRFPMTVGENYLVFASVELGLLLGYPVFAVSNCGNSGLLSESQPKLEEARRLAKSRPTHHLSGTAQKRAAP